jgi:DNA processing protein
MESNTKKHLGIGASTVNLNQNSPVDCIEMEEIRSDSCHSIVTESYCDASVGEELDFNPFDERLLTKEYLKYAGNEELLEGHRCAEFVPNVAVFGSPPQSMVTPFSLVQKSSVGSNVEDLEHSKVGNHIDDNDPLYLVALTMIEKVGPKTSRALMQHFGTAAEIFRANKSKLARLPMVGEKIITAIHRGEFLRAAEREIGFARRNGIEVVTWNDACYPLKLKEVCDSPMVIYVKGELPEIDKPHIAVVGTRKPSAYGKKMAAEFSAYFAERGIVVVSGLAFGIDIEAHSSTLAQGGCTLAVLGHGLDQVYPREHTLKAKQIVDRGGALVTEFCSGTQPDAYNFPARNRIISGLCDAVLVVEANEKGGALITAKMAFEQDREVFAIPGNLGNPTGIGCNRLIRDQIAKIACEPQDVIESMQHLIKLNIEDRPAKKRKVSIQLSHREQSVCDALCEKTLDFDAIEALSVICGAELRSVLLGLEFRQIVMQVAGNKYQLAA